MEDRVLVENTDIVKIINSAIRTIPGFTGSEELLSLFNLVYATSYLEGDIIEIGSFCGRSSVIIGLAAKLSGSIVHCIDLFPCLDDWEQRKDGHWMIRTDTFSAYQTEHPIYNELFKERFRTAYTASGNLLERFKHYTKLYDVDSIICPHQGNVETFSACVPDGFRVKFAFIDGDHDYLSVCQDIEIVSRWLVPYGVLCIDDFGGDFTAVTNAVNDTITDDFEDAHKLTRKLFVIRKK